MKGKLSFMWRATLALVLVLSLGVIMAVPVAADVSQPAVTVDPVLQSVDAEYTIVFTNTNTIPGGNWITVTFPDGTTVPATYLTGDVTVQGASIAGADVTGVAVTRVVTIVIPDSIAADTEITVVFTVEADITNPTAGADLTLTVATEVETNEVTSATYDILALPNVTLVQPDKGNAGETMWVEVTGDDFTGTTTACTTSFDFGTGVSVVADSYHWISTSSVDCQITIASDATAGARAVTATSVAGADLTPLAAGLTVGAADTAQVDAWDNYTPVTDLANDDWDGTTLVMDGDRVYTTIEAAVDAADTTGEVIRVHEATYAPVASGPSAINIDIASVNLVAIGSPVIVPVRDGGNAFSNGVISITAANVIVDGFDIQNVATSVQGDCGIRVLGTGGTFTIQNNTVSGFGNAVTNAPNNTRAISAMTAGSGTILDNTVEDNRLGIELSASANTTIQGNLVQNNYWGIGLFGASTGLKVIKNRVLSNYGGIDVNATSAGIYYTNDIVGNTKGFNDCTAIEQDARYNWWGDISGPSAYDYTSAALGSGGDTVNDDGSGTNDVLYEPWLTESKVLTVSDGIAYFGSTMTLQPGWNTLSVPLKLKDSANTIAEIAALGDFLTDTNWEIAYQYNPALPGWENIGTSAIELVPGRGYYIKILGTVDVNFPVLYNGALSLPTYDLTTTGWNLIGSMFGIKQNTVQVGDGQGDYGIAATNDVLDGKMTVALALDSIGANTSVVVSPYLPGQYASFGTNSSGGEFMQVGEAYWVFMEATDTLAGFEVTPIYKVFLE